MIMPTPRRVNYEVEYRGELYKIPAKDLLKLNDKMGGMYRHSDPAKRRYIIDTYCKLNAKYIDQYPFGFQSQEDREDWRQIFLAFLPDFFFRYEPAKGHLNTYLVSAKQAAFSRWQDKRDQVRISTNRRLELYQLKRRMKNSNYKKTEQDEKLLSETNFTYASLNFRPSEDSDEFVQILQGSDGREEMEGLSSESDLFECARRVLDPEDFQLILWSHRDGETLAQIGNRINVTRERVRQRLVKIHQSLKIRLRGEYE